jgi:exodeoxyribonuclease VIII
METGIYKNILNETYHRSKEWSALSCSGIKDFLKAPAVYKAKKETAESTNDAFLLGSAFHAVVLEPDVYEESFAVFDGTRRGKAWESFAQENCYKTIITPSIQSTVEAMREAVMKDETALALISAQGECEESVFWNDATYGFPCKCRPDKRIPELKMLIDLKSTVDASPEGFAKSVINYGYDIQAAWYLSGINAAQSDLYRDFLFVAVEKNPPYLTQVYRATDDVIESGKKKIRSMIGRYAECLKTDVWPGYDGGVIDIVLPSWAIK